MRRPFTSFRVTNNGKGRKTPSQPTRSVVLSEAKDLRLFSKNDKNSFGWSWRREKRRPLRMAFMGDG
jgi:hypothetical protein